MPSSKPVFEDLRNITDDRKLYLIKDELRRYFQISLDGCVADHTVTRRLFWEQIYRQRSLERRKFVNILRDPAPRLILITGVVGCGKSTFVMEKMEKPDDADGRPHCCGIRIDLEQHQNELRRAEMDAREYYIGRDPNTDSEEYVPVVLGDFVAQELDTLVANKVKGRFIRHFKILLRNPSSWEKFLQCDVVNRPFLELDQPNAAEDNLLINDAELAAAAAVVLSAQIKASQEILSTVTSGRKPEELNSLAKQFEAVRSYLREHPENVDSQLVVSGRPTDEPRLARYWLRAYAAFFSLEPAIVFLDNGDCLPHTSLYSALLLFADELASAVGEADSVLLRPLKVILSLRENNLLPIKGHAEGTRSPSAIVLSSEPYGIEPGNAEFLGLTQEHMGEILRRRLRLCEDMLVADDLDAGARDAFNAFREVVETVWIPIYEDTTLLKPVGRRPSLVELANESIRLGIAMVRHSSTVIAYGNRQRQRAKWTNYVPMHLDMRSKIIGWLFEGDRSGVALQNFVARERGLIQGGESFCCSHRMILTYLSNRMLAHHRRQADSRVAARELFEELERTVGLEEEQAREALWFLYKPGQFHREYVVFEQSRALPGGAGEESEEERRSNAAQIDRNARVYINRRGEVLIRRIMPTIDYWGQVEQARSPGLSSVFDREPPEALAFFVLVARTFEETAGAHERNWSKLVCGDHGLTVADWERPFDRFHPNFAIGQDFFAERVAQSHMASIRAYVVCLIRNLADRDAISQGELKDILPGQRDTIDKLMGTLERFHADRPEILWHVEIGKLLGLLKTYQDILNQFSILKSKTKRELALADL